jgi:hypothetical protein
MSNLFRKYAARTYVFNTSSSVYLVFARKRVKRRFVITDISTSNITLCREHHVARELRFERVWSRFFRNFKSSLSQTWPRCLASAICRFVVTPVCVKSGETLSSVCSVVRYQHFADGESVSSAVIP